MYTKVSEKLIEKMTKDLVEITSYISRDKLYLQFEDGESDLYKECILWRETINTYFLSSETMGSLKKFLNYKFVRPESILHNIVIFSFEHNYNPTWKDWFIVEEGVDSASIITT